MDIEKIKNAKTKYIGKEVEYHKEINSTHVLAIQQAQSEHGKIVIADIQTGGIGTKGRNWYTGAGKNIAMTIILNPECDIKKLNDLTIKLAHIIKDSIKELYNYNLQIKEPNDLLLNNKKICGILTQAKTKGEVVNKLLISIGFNVNETDFDDHTIDIATSLKKEFDKEFKREDIIIKFIEELERYLSSIF